MRRSAPFLALPLLLGGCAALQSVGRPEGRDAILTFRLLTLFSFATGFFFLLTMAFLVAAYWRQRGSREDGLDDELTVPSKAPVLKTALLVWTAAASLVWLGLLLVEALGAGAAGLLWTAGAILSPIEKFLFRHTENL